jgi:hypothetical protein
LRRFSARRAALLAATVVLSTITPGFFAAALAEGPTVTLTGTISAANGLEIYDEVSLIAADGTRVDNDSINWPEPGFSLQGPPGQYTFRLETPTPTYADGFESGDDGAPGLILDVPIDLTDNMTVDWILPIVDFPVHVVTWEGNPVSGLWLHGESERSFELAPGVSGSGRLRNANRILTDGEGNGTLLSFEGAAPTSITAIDQDVVLGRVSPAASDTSALLVLDHPSDTPGPPQNVTATAGDGKVKVTWQPPVSDGGSPITGYTVTASRNSSNFKASFGPSATSGTIRSLINGKTYTVTVVAKNANGTGTASPKISVTLPDVDPPPTTTTTAPPLGGAGSDDDNDGPGTTVPTRSGYWLLDTTGVVYPFGDAALYGDPAAKLAAASEPGIAVRAVDLEPTPSMNGYWVLDNRGRVHPFGDASHLGDVAPGRLSAGEEPATLSATPSGAGYWVFTNRGEVIAFGDAAALGDMTGTTLNGPVLDSVATPSGQGYYMVASDGGIFAFGDARFAGSMGGKHLNAAVRSLVPDGDGTGYWLVAADGGVFAFDAPFVGSMGGRPLNKPVRGMVRYGNGYLMVAEDGGVFAFSDLPFSGSLGARPPASPIVSVAALA